jgi:uncharacterized protein
MFLTYLAAVVMALGVRHPASPTYEAEIERWRQARVASLTADDGWLTVAGLFWLKEGANTVGTAAGSDFVLPAGSAREHLGTFYFSHGQTRFEAAPGATVALNGTPAASATLKPDTSGKPDLLQVNALTMFVIQRGDRYGIRLRDKASEMRRHFTGLHYFPVDEAYRVVARWVPYEPPKQIPVPNILGQTEMETCPGYVEFTLNGRALRLDPVVEGDQLFLIFRDLTSGQETYPSGRFLYANLPEDGQVQLDFNKAYNPPCAFTPFATCPLPPAGNALPIRIEAGELSYGH